MQEATSIDEKRLGAARVPTKPLIALLVLSLLGSAAYLVWGTMQPPTLRQVRVRSGAVATLSAVTYGTLHRYDPVPPLQRLLETIGLAKDLPKPATDTTSKPEVRLWYSYRPLNPDPAADEIIYRFEDEHGCPVGAGTIGDVSAEYDKHIAFSWRPSEAIPYGRPFDFCGHHRDTRAEAFRFHVEPPPEGLARQPSQALKPDSLPHTVVTPDFRVTLKSVERLLSPEPHYRADIRGFDSRGAPIVPMCLRVMDRYRTRAERFGSLDRRRLGTDHILFWGLCRKEPAWKLIATFARKPHPNSTPDAVWDFPRVSVGGKTTTQRRGARTLSVRCLPMTATPGEPERMIVWLHNEDRKSSSRVVLTQINGRVVRQSAAAPKEGDFAAELIPDLDWIDGFVVPLPARSSALRLQFAEYSGHEVEFIVTPP